MSHIFHAGLRCRNLTNPETKGGSDQNCEIFVEKTVGRSGRTDQGGGAGTQYRGVDFSEEEVRSLEIAYGFDLNQETHALARAGSTRNLMRHVERDGLRVMAVLGQHLEPGENPVEIVQQGLKALGFDVRGE